MPNSDRGIDGALDCNVLRSEWKGTNNSFKKFGYKEKERIGVKLEKKQAFLRKSRVRPI